MKVISFLISLIFYAIGAVGLFSLVLWKGDLLPFVSFNTVGTSSLSYALLINFGLIALFGIQHSVMPRKSFKAWMTQFIPAHLERSIYVGVSGLLCFLIVFKWQAINGSLWSIENHTIGYKVVYGIYLLGIVVLGLSSFLINHFELFGVKQTYDHLKGSSPAPPEFKSPLLYKIVRHPIYLGFLMILWACPTMTFTHLALAVGMTGYILIGVVYEERDLIELFGDTYTKYQKKVPRLLPFIKF